MTQVPALYKRPISTFYVVYVYHRSRGSRRFKTASHKYERFQVTNKSHNHVRVNRYLQIPSIKSVESITDIKHPIFREMPQQSSVMHKFMLQHNHVMGIFTTNGFTPHFNL